MSLSNPAVRGCRTEWILFLVTLLLHAAVALEHTHRFPGELLGDEVRYVAYAKNILLGSYVPDDNPDFVNGPGYPLVLVPFEALGVPIVWARLLNSVFVAAAVVLLYRIVERHAGRVWALIAALWTGFHMDMLTNSREAVTEALTLLLVTAVGGAFCLAQAHGRKGWLWCVVCGVLLAVLTMTRVMFGHVTVVMILGSAVMLLFWTSGRPALLRALVASVIALVLCLPYLAYTKAKTGKTYCWSTNSGELLFWMTRTHPDHNGCWHSFEAAMTNPGLAPQYAAFFSRVTQLPALEREHEFTEEAMKSLKTAPKSRLAYNWVCNVCRLLVAYPTALRREGLTSVAVSVMNAPFLVLVVGAFLVAVWRRKSVPPEYLILFAVAIIYTGGSTLATARSRYFVVITPLLWMALTAILDRNLRLGFKSRNEEEAAAAPRGDQARELTMRSTRRMVSGAVG